MTNQIGKFADAVRQLLWGNGDIRTDALELEKVLREYEGVDLSPDQNRIAQIADSLAPMEHQYFSGEHWNKVQYLDASWSDPDLIPDSVPSTCTYLFDGAFTQDG